MDKRGTGERSERKARWFRFSLVGHGFSKKGRKALVFFGCQVNSREGEEEESWLFLGWGFSCLKKEERRGVKEERRGFLSWLKKGKAQVFHLSRQPIAFSFFSLCTSRFRSILI